MLAQDRNFRKAPGTRANYAAALCATNKTKKKPSDTDVCPFYISVTGDPLQVSSCNTDHTCDAAANTRSIRKVLGVTSSMIEGTVHVASGQAKSGSIASVVRSHVAAQGLRVSTSVLYQSSNRAKPRTANALEDAMFGQIVRYWC
jgi:hypothetical protein